MESYLISNQFDLITPDALVKKIEGIDQSNLRLELSIKNISPVFLGFTIPKEKIFFNLKSTLAQLGLNSKLIFLELSKEKKEATLEIILYAISDIGKALLPLIEKESSIGKLFALDDSRKVRDPNYLMRMAGRTDRNGSPLLSLGGPNGRDDLILEKIKGYTVAFLPVKKGIVKYQENIYSFLPTIAKLLKHKKFKIRELLKLHQIWEKDTKTTVQKNNMLLVRTEPLHIRTVFARVAHHLLPNGFYHTSACVLQPDTDASGNIYEFYGSSEEEIKEIPLEFYTLEPYKEHVFFEDRDQLQSSLENPLALFDTFKKAPKDDVLSSVFVVKGTQLKSLKKTDWVKKETYKHEFPGLNHPSRQASLVNKYIKEQPSYPFLKAIEEGLITSQGVLFSKFFPSPLTKRIFLSTQVQKSLKGIYFEKPSKSCDIYFSHEDRAFLLDLAKFAIPVYWVDNISKKILKYVVRPDKDAGMFIPLDLIEKFRRASFFGVYGSNLIEGNFAYELKNLLSSLLEIQKDLSHPLFNSKTPLALVTGGGPGAMKIANKIAKELNILSCANIVDFRQTDKSVVSEQKINPHIDAKMTYRLDRLVERQAEFHLDFPICLQGGIGMDFELSLEEVTRKVGAIRPTPILLFGDTEYWQDKLTSKFQRNIKSGTTKGSEWVSNCFYCIQTSKQGIQIYKDFFEGKLKIGKNGPIYKDGFFKF